MSFRIASRPGRWALGVLLLALPLLLFGRPALARDRGPEPFAKSVHVLHSKKSGDIPFLMEETLNHAGQKEVTVYDQIIDGVVTHGEARVMVGRDLDGDGFYDAWFVLGHGGVVKAIDRVAKRSDGWDAVSRILRDNAEIFKERNLALIWFEWVSRLSAGKNKLLELEQAQVNLHSLEIMTDRIAALDKRSEIARINYARLSEAWLALAQKAQQGRLFRIGEAALDTALSLTGIALFKWAAPVLKRFGIQVVESSFGQFLGGLQRKYIGGFSRGVRASLLRVAGKMPALPGSLTARVAAVYQPLKITSRNVVEVTRHMVEVMEQHDKLARALVHFTRHAIQVGRLGLTKKTYVASVAGIQTGIELYQRRNVLFDLNPIVLPERVRNWKDLALNIGFMTTETFVGSGVARLLNNGYASMGICAIFSTADSMLWTRVIKGETDVVRLSLDTSWEVAVGNLQTTVIDPAGFGLGAALATKFDNNRFHLVGWAVMLVDQALGFYGYNYATTKAYERAKAAYDRHKAGSPDSGHEPELPPVRFVPILAPL